VPINGASAILPQLRARGHVSRGYVGVTLRDIDPDLQQNFLSVPAGSVVEPIPRGDGFQLCRIVKKMEPNADDPVVQERVDKRLLDLHFSKLVGTHIQWQGPMTK